MPLIRQLDTPSMQLEHIHTRCFDYGWSEGVFADLLIKPHHRTYVFEVEGEILTICTDPDFQKRGLARMLLQQVIKTLRAEGAESLFLEAAIDNPAALRLYESVGFIKTGRRKAYYSRKDKPPADAYILRLAL